ncbi:MAG TPA: DUF4328 domain-containing protein [Ilumatobacter sp.]
MTNLPPPPPPGDGAVPPPPPPQLIAPGGYVGYSGGAVPLKRVGGLQRAASLVITASVLVLVLELVVSATLDDDAQAFLDGRTSSEQFLEDIAPYLLLTFAQGGLVIASIVLVLIWMRRLAVNHRALQRVGTWGPGWAIGGWFLPPLLYVIPTLMLRELWRASDPDVPIGGDWRSRPASPLIDVWFVAYSLIPLVLTFVQTDTVLSGIGGSEQELADQLTGGQATVIASTLASVVAAAVWIRMTQALTSRHRRLTGETPA